MAKHKSGELRCPATALIVLLFFFFQKQKSKNFIGKIFNIFAQNIDCV